MVYISDNSIISKSSEKVSNTHRMFGTLTSFYLSFQYNYFHNYISLLHMWLLGSPFTPLQYPLEVLSALDGEHSAWGVV